MVVSNLSEQGSSRPSLGANWRIAETVGGGPALDTRIGAVAGTAGAAVNVLTKGDHVYVPARELLSFRLDQPIRLQGYRGSSEIKSDSRLMNASGTDHRR